MQRSEAWYFHNICSNSLRHEVIPVSELKVVVPIIFANTYY